jgi:nucleoside 2-deoxyribosyltransferase
MKVFIAAPFFNARERKFNEELAKAIREFEFIEDVWIAQEHGFLNSGSYKDKRRIFEMDLKALEECDVVVALLDGECIDSGTAFELGYAFALKKPIVGIKTDYRTFSGIEELNLMVEVSLKKLIKCKDLNAAKDELKRELSLYDSAKRCFKAKS